MKNYVKMLGYYGLEFTSSCLNFLASVFGLYPSFDFGVNYLLFFETKRIHKEKAVRQAKREQQESEASSMEEDALSSVDD
tara:strand:- start:2560 stop:2799 length:240 start_codon:yes stop_codon:yes gene_type:complete